MSISKEAINVNQIANIELETFPKFSLARMMSNDRHRGEFEYERSYYDPSIIKSDKIIDIYTKSYDSISDVIDSINSGKNVHIKYTGNETIDQQIKISDGQIVTLDFDKDATLSGTTNLGGNGRLFMVENGTLIVNGNGATISVDNDSYGVFRVEENGSLELNNIILENIKKNGLNIKILGGSAILNNVTVNSTTGGAIEVTESNLGSLSKPGSAVINNCIFNQSAYGDWCSTCLSVSGNSYVLVNSGTFTSENYCTYVFSSGGTIEINNGTFNATGDKECIMLSIDSGTYPGYTASTLIHDGSFIGNAKVPEGTVLIIDGGTFTFDPSNYIDTDNYEVVETDGKYTVKKK